MFFCFRRNKLQRMYLADCNRVDAMKRRPRVRRGVSSHQVSRNTCDMPLFGGTAGLSCACQRRGTVLSPKAKFCPNNIRMKQKYCSISRKGKVESRKGVIEFYFFNDNFFPRISISSSLMSRETIASTHAESVIGSNVLSIACPIV